MIVATDPRNVLQGVQGVKVICELFVRKNMEITTISVFAGFMTVLWGIGMRMLSNEIRYSVDKINSNSTELSFTQEIKQELYDLLTLALDDTVGNMQMPSAMDHAIGALSSFMQHKLLNQVPNLKEGLSDLTGYGQETNQEENTPFTQ